MEDYLPQTEEATSYTNSEVYGKTVRAGKRTYFFDVKTTKRNEHFLTITESKKKFDKDGKPHYEKHKIYLYREDFEKFKDCFNDVLAYIDEQEPIPNKSEHHEMANKFEEIDFEDLNK